MPRASNYSRLNIYLDEPTLLETIKIAAARAHVSASTYCLRAVRGQLVADGFLPAAEAALGPRGAAQALDRLRSEIGPIGVKARELIAEGRAR